MVLVYRSTLQSTCYAEYASDSLLLRLYNLCLINNSQDKTAKLWNALDLTLIGTLKGHKRGIWRVEFRYIPYHIDSLYINIYISMHAGTAIDTPY
jgi:WD40 repeat protein